MNRDIKLENIMLKSKDPIKPILKVCDFGYSINENHSLPKTAVGTPGYTGTSQPQHHCFWLSGVLRWVTAYLHQLILDKGTLDPSPCACPRDGKAFVPNAEAGYQPQQKHMGSVHLSFDMS